MKSKRKEGNRNKNNREENKSSYLEGVLVGAGTSLYIIFSTLFSCWGENTSFFLLSLFITYFLWEDQVDGIHY